MRVTEDETFEKHAEQCEHSAQTTLLPYEYERTCFSCGNNVIKKQFELTK